MYLYRRRCRTALLERDPGKKYGARVPAINVSGINEEEAAGALNGHDAAVKNDYRPDSPCAKRRDDDRYIGDCIISARA